MEPPRSVAHTLGMHDALEMAELAADGRPEGDGDAGRGDLSIYLISSLPFSALLSWKSTSFDFSPLGNK